MWCPEWDSGTRKGYWVKTKDLWIKFGLQWSEVKVVQLCLTLCDPMGCPWNSPGQNTRMGCLSLLHGIFPTKESNPGLLAFSNTVQILVRRPWCWERLRTGGEGDDRDEMVPWHCDSRDLSLNKLWEMVKDREAWHAGVHGFTERHNWATEHNKLVH